MPTYDEVLLLGAEYALLAVLPIALILLARFAVRRHRRNYVWLDIEFKGGRVIRPLVKPPKEGVVTTKKWGSFFIDERAVRFYKNRPMYRVVENVLFPIAYDRSTVSVPASEDMIIDGKPVKKGETVVQEIANPILVTPSSARVAAYLRDKTHAQVYGGSDKFELLLIVIAVLVVIAILVGVAK